MDIYSVSAEIWYSRVCKQVQLVVRRDRKNKTIVCLSAFLSVCGVTVSASIQSADTSLVLVSCLLE